MQLDILYEKVSTYVCRKAVNSGDISIYVRIPISSRVAVVKCNFSLARSCLFGNLTTMAIGSSPWMWLDNGTTACISSARPPSP